jgi:cephalosporin hydroxylase
MKKILKKLLPEKLFIVYRFLKQLYRNQVYFDVPSIYDGHFNVTYREVRALKCPFDYVMYQMLVFKMKPDLIVEIGADYGGGALYLADLLNIIGKGEVHAIDIEDKVGNLVKSHPRIKLFFKGWQEYELPKGVKNILVIDDGSHLYEEVLGALKKFSPYASYYVVEDGIVDELGKFKNESPIKAINEFLSENTGWEVDREYCDMFGKNATFNVNGYLKKTK